MAECSSYVLDLLLNPFDKSELLPQIAGRGEVANPAFVVGS